MSAAHRRGPVAATALAALLCACAKGGVVKPVNVVAGARMAAIKSFRVAIEDKTFDTDDPQTVEDSAAGTGLVDYARRRSEIMTDGTTGQMQQITVGPDSWIKGLYPDTTIRSATGLVPSGADKPWVHFDNPNGSLRTGLGDLDPAVLIGWLTAKDTQVHQAGTERVRGVMTTHYLMRTSVADAETSAFVRYALDLWVDDQNLVRRMRLTLYTRAQPADSPPTPAETTVQTADFYDFGIPVEIEPPPAAEVTTLPTVPRCPATSTLPPSTLPPSTLGLAACRD